MRSSYISLVGLVATLSFSVYSFDAGRKLEYNEFAKSINAIRKAAAQPGYQNVYLEFVNNVMKRRRCDEAAAKLMVRRAIEKDYNGEWTSVAKDAADVRLTRLGLPKGSSVENAAKDYYDAFVMDLFDSDLVIYDDAGGQIERLKYGFSYDKAINVTKRAFGSTGSAIVWDVYERFKNSKNVNEKIVAAASALLGWSLGNNKAVLESVDNGVEVYKCILNLGSVSGIGMPAADKQNATIAKLLEILPAFKKSLKDKGLMNAVNKPMQQRGNDEQTGEDSEKQMQQRGNDKQAEKDSKKPRFGGNGGSNTRSNGKKKVFGKLHAGV